LEEPEHSGFGWGYNGGGTSATAAAILADALDLDPDEFDLIEADDETLESLREDFCTDVLAVCADEFRLRRGAVLRWVRGWYAQHGVTDLPSAVADLPPVDPER
jgi:hypothetical protein